jgi:uncharacterized protein
MAVGTIRRDRQSAPFFDGTAAGELRVRLCQRCGHRSIPQSQQCPACRSTELGWEAASGRASVVSWAVVHGKPGADGVPSRTVVGLVELAEGPWLHAQLDVDPDAVSAGQQLQVHFETPEGGEAIPVFRPV